MKSWLRKGVVAAAITLVALSGTQVPALAQSAQDRRGQEQHRLEGIWDVSVTVQSCATGMALFTGRAVLMFIDGGTLTEIADRSNRSAGLGTWRHLAGSSYIAREKFIDYTAAGAFNGTEVITREIELSKNADEYTATATTQVFNSADQLISTGCATSTATRFE